MTNFSARSKHEDTVVVARAELLQLVADMPPTRETLLVEDRVSECTGGRGSAGAQPLCERFSKRLLVHQPTLNASTAMWRTAPDVFLTKRWLPAAFDTHAWRYGV